MSKVYCFRTDYPNPATREMCSDKPHEIAQWAIDHSNRWEYIGMIDPDTPYPIILEDDPVYLALQRRQSMWQAEDVPGMPFTCACGSTFEAADFKVHVKICKNLAEIKQALSPALQKLMDE